MAAVDDVVGRAAACVDGGGLRRRVGGASGARWPTVMAPIGAYSSGMPNSERKRGRCSGMIPKKHAPSPSSTAVSSMSRDAIPVSMNQYGAGHRASARSSQPLSGSA